MRKLRLAKTSEELRDIAQSIYDTMSKFDIGAEQSAMLLAAVTAHMFHNAGYDQRKYECIMMKFCRNYKETYWRPEDEQNSN